jgi:hypothetical protein
VLCGAGVTSSPASPPTSASCIPGPRYCGTPAGRVAYSASGAGPALLFESGWVSHLRGQLELGSFGSFVERLTERFTVIR